MLDSNGDPCYPMLADRELRVFICKPFAPDRDEFAFARSLSAPVKGRFALGEGSMEEQLGMFDTGTRGAASATDGAHETRGIR